MILLALFALVAANMSGVKMRAVRGEVPDAYNFWLYEPDSMGNDSVKPLVLFLHGASLCGRDLSRVKRYGTIDAIEKGRTLDAFVVAPQNPGGAWNPKRLMNIVEWVSERLPVDSNRVYVLGMSLGGYGTIDMAATYPDRIAAAMAFCGGGTVKDLSGLNDVPLWIVHGTADRAVSVQQSDRVVSAMKQANDSTPRLIYNRVPGMNHGQPARLLYLQESYDWLMSHSLTDPDRTVNEGFDPGASDLRKRAYQGLKSTGRKSKASSKKAKKRRARTRK